MKKLLFLLFPLCAAAQQTSFAPYKNYPFTNELAACATGSKIAWAMDEQGKRNIYVAEGPAFVPRQLTHFTNDDGQEISSVSISRDGKWLVFVRGGDHGGNWDIGMPVNPLADINAFKVQVAAIPFAGGEVKYISEGDDPVVSANNTLAFIKAGQAWAANLDSNSTAKNLFTARGTTQDLQWSPDGTQLIFVSNRRDHAIIGCYTKGSSNINWIAPSFSRDGSPQWSPDGKKIVFVRRPVTGGTPDSMLVPRPRPWSIYTADIDGTAASLVWKSPNTLAGSFPVTDGNANLHWAAKNRIVFLSSHDNWPHLYSIDVAGGKETLLTPGKFMCEHIRTSTDGAKLIFSANTGPLKDDIDRRHVAVVSTDKADMHMITPGAGLEWMPVMTGDARTVAFICGNGQQPPLPAVFNIGDSNRTVLCKDHLAADFPMQKLVTPEQVIFTSPDGTIIHAQLFRPATTKQKRPAIVYIHGGPSRQMLLGWNYSAYYCNAYASNQYLASLGFVVLSVNYRLGIGYGYAFQQAPHSGTVGAAEYQDIKAAGEWLQKQPFVEASEIGVYGGSYGGYLTAMALARDSKIFAAGVDIHGVHDWVGRSSLLTAFNDEYEKAPDYDKAVKIAWQSSPVSSMNTWKSPVLIIHADDDRNVAFSQSVDLISRLEKKKIPYETLMIVDDTHHWMNFKNSQTVYAAAAAFFQKHLK